MDNNRSPQIETKSPIIIYNHSSNPNISSPYSSTLPQFNTQPQILSPRIFELSPTLKENVIYDEAILERKQASFENLKKWDNHRSHYLHNHGKFVDILLSRLDQKIEFSNTFMHKITKFFKEKAIQESEYAAFIHSRLPKFSKLFNDNINENSSLFKGFSEIDEINIKKTQQLEIFVAYIEKTIIKEILYTENSEFNKKISLYKARIQDIKKTLSRINVETAEKSTKYSKVFYEMSEPQLSSKNQKNTKDLLNLELGFLKIAEEQSQLHRDLGVEAVNLWKELMKLEINRFHTIQKVMLNYLIQSENLKGQAKHEFQSLDPVNEVDAMYSINGLFTKDDLFIVEKYKDKNSGEINMEDCFKYLQNIEIEKLKEDHLILKEILLERDYSNNLKEFKPCLIIFTIDNNLLIFDEPKSEDYNPANFCLKMDGIQVLQRDEEKMAEITAKVTGFLFDSKNRFVFKFENNDKVEEFVNYFNFINLKKN